MNMNPGYKQKEVGAIPEDWEIKRLGDIAEIVMGQSPSSLNYNTKGVGLPLIQGNADIFNRKTIKRIFTTQITKRGRREDILMSVRAPVGEISRAMFDVCLGRGVCAIRYSNNFLYHALIAKESDWAKLSKGSTFDSVNSTDVRNFEIELPTNKKEQTAIAEALSDADEYIESLEQLIAKKRQIKLGAMQELLKPKEDWVEKRLGNTATLKARIGWQGLTTAEYLSTGDYFLVTGTEFKNGYIDWDSCHYVSESRYKQDKNIQLKKHDVLVTKDGTIGKVALISYLEKPATLNSGVFVIRPIGNAFHPQFFYYLLLSDVFDEFLNQLSAGSTINHLYQKDFVNFTYRTPATPEEQAKIATILSDMDAEIAALETRLLKARQIKQGLMQELLTGRIRLV